MADKALRYNSGKAKYSMLDLTCLEPGVRVLEFGANKYARDNWKKGLPLSEILDSLLRHIGAIQRGEFIDLESGLSHVGHIQCNALFLGNPNTTIDVESDNLKVREQGDLSEFVQVDLSEAIQEEDHNILAELTDDELGFINGNSEHSNDASRYVESTPVSMEEYDAFVYALTCDDEPNDELKRLTDSVKKEARYYGGFGVCGHRINDKKKLGHPI